MHYEVSKDGFTLWSLLDLGTFEVFQDLYYRPILNHAFDYWLAEIILNLLGKVVRPNLDQPDWLHCCYTFINTQNFSNLHLL